MVRVWILMSLHILLEIYQIWSDTNLPELTQPNLLSTSYVIFYVNVYEQVCPLTHITCQNHQLHQNHQIHQNVYVFEFISIFCICILTS